MPKQDYGQFIVLDKEASEQIAEAMTRNIEMEEIFRKAEHQKWLEYREVDIRYIRLVNVTNRFINALNMAQFIVFMVVAYKILSL